MMRRSSLIATLAAHPRWLFVFDGVGALVTAAAVGLVLPALPALVGVPAAVLRLLAVAACVVAGWSLTWGVLVPHRWPWGLRVVALANAAYCAATAACLWRFFDRLRVLDWVYFPAELALVAVLASIEWQVATVGLRAGGAAGAVRAGVPNDRESGHVDSSR